MPTRVHIHYQHDLKGITPALVNAAGAEASNVAAHWWDEEFEPQHFLPSAMQRYAYVPRTKRYMLLKAKRYGHQNPLEFSGRSKAAAESGVQYQQNPQQGQTTLRFTGLPRYWFMYQRTGKKIDKPKELTTVLPSEEKKLSEVAAPVLVERLMSSLPSTTKTI